MTNALDLNRINGRAGESTQQNATKRIAKRDSEATFKRLDEEFSIMFSVVVDHGLNGEGFEGVGKSGLLFLFDFVSDCH